MFVMVSRYCRGNYMELTFYIIVVRDMECRFWQTRWEWERCFLPTMTLTNRPSRRLLASMGSFGKAPKKRESQISAGVSISSSGISSLNLNATDHFSPGVLTTSWVRECRKFFEHKCLR